MKILLVNKFYYHRGGADSYSINLERLLKQQGCEVAFFAMQHPQNLPSDYAKYFPSEVEYAAPHKKGFLKLFLRPLGSKEVKRKFTALVNDFKPDVVHLNNIHTQLSPIIAEIAYNKGIKVVWTVHDSKLLCPRYDCQRNNQPCELCYHNKLNVIKYNCIKNNRLASLLGYLEALKWNKDKLEKYTQIFICPSTFMQRKMLSGKFDAHKLKVMCNFTSQKRKVTENFQKENYYCYVGRLSKEKGIETLFQAAQQLPFSLHIAGDGPLYEILKAQNTNENIQFLGHINAEQVNKLITNALFTVLPSECYENNPLSVIESLCLGTPVLGANIGGIPELMETSALNRIFQSGNVNDLKKEIEWMWHRNLDKTDYSGLAQSSQNQFDEISHYNELMRLYES
ncbi:glycosyl transferase [Bacteroidia bacterium]|nr:glycosyl transferase [Bacteroidia bacterium]